MIFVITPLFSRYSHGTRSFRLYVLLFCTSITIRLSLNAKKISKHEWKSRKRYTRRKRKKYRGKKRTCFSDLLPLVRYQLNASRINHVWPSFVSSVQRLARAHTFDASTTNQQTQTTGARFRAAAAATTTTTTTARTRMRITVTRQDEDHDSSLPSIPSCLRTSAIFSATSRLRFRWLFIGFGEIDWNVRSNDNDDGDNHYNYVYSP